eukprot:m.883086 g.883086  ORF g.883086 m.883086 type:complete len:175 (+) comp23602_c0_seq2:175-699(+)
MASTARHFARGRVDDIHRAQRRLVQHVVYLLPRRRFASTRSKASAVVQALEAEGKSELKSPTPNATVVTSVLARLAALYTSPPPCKHPATIAVDPEGGGSAVDNAGVQRAVFDHIRRVQHHPAFQNSNHVFFEAAVAEASRIRAGENRWRQDLLNVPNIVCFRSDEKIDCSFLF